MMSEKEKLEEELKLLEESLKLEVITKEEYEEAKQRIEGTINDLEEKNAAHETDVKEESKPDEEEKEQIKEEGTEEEPEEKKITQEEFKIKEVKGEDIIKKKEVSINIEIGKIEAEKSLARVRKEKLVETIINGINDYYD